MEELADSSVEIRNTDNGKVCDNLCAKLHIHELVLSTGKIIYIHR